MSNFQIEYEVEKLKITGEHINVVENCYLRALSTADVTDSYVNGLNDSEVRRYLGNSRRITQTFESVNAYVSQNREGKNSILLGIFLEERLIGTVRLHDIDTIYSEGYIGIALFDKYEWGKGFGGKALAVACDLVKGRLRLSRLNAVIEEKNLASQRVFSRCGFSVTDSVRDLWSISFDR